MTRAWRCSCIASRHGTRWFASSARRREIRSIAELPPRIYPGFRETSNHDLLALQWPTLPRSILFVRKNDDAPVQNALHEYTRHVKSTYPDTNLVFEPDVAKQIHEAFDFPIYSVTEDETHVPYHEKVDLTTTLGGDGTILHAASLFATATSVPPVLSFSMGTLGFLGEWKFPDYKRAFRDVYVSGHPSSLHAPDPLSTPTDGGSGPATTSTWPSSSPSLRGKSMGPTRAARILMRNRLRIGIFSPTGARLPHEPPFAHPSQTQSPNTTTNQDIFALNEVLLHRGANPHLAHLTILIGTPPSHQRVLTTAIADGFLISTPTGSTAYSLSSGGSIVHPLVSSLLLTPICPRSLSFRPLVLPSNTPVTLRIEAANRGKEIEVSVDGVRRKQGLRAGMEVRVVGEDVRTPGTRDWRGGVPSIVRSGGVMAEGEDHWVGGLNGLLKFNYPFGEEG
ncbi:NADH kinase pos5 [Friedmanniomyces endolithicus]|uniref:NADH kinase pos5 n=1 Tax=Friedmanniomyces endolithicus TaxID=329885 RepID=A0AAN6JGH4_9PEZI|nr:NADH kinase pos5 [Friedmanniomyces endolithicus]KAK0298904.1 NADH kinase pos5 [Friedmanniomyces endolithicus]KAK0328896.1 NADH kinase pos5 [Friedmanniomyces endolithicus]KAK1003877.1 NADH kinase pos5 [Friedmanniomyces endolithicus]